MTHHPKRCLIRPFGPFLKALHEFKTSLQRSKCRFVDDARAVGSRLEGATVGSMTEQKPAAQAIAGLALSSSLMEALLKRGMIEQTDAETIIRDAASYVAAFCIDAPPEIEREALRILKLIGSTERNVAVAQSTPEPVVDPASS